MKIQHFLSALLIAGMALPAAASELQGKLPPASPIRPPESGAALVGKLLSPDPLDPGVPLPDPRLSEAAPENAADKGLRPYARQESGGGVVGLRIPIPAIRGQ